MATRPAPGLRGWAASTINWPPARNATKYLVHGAAEARGEWLLRRGALPKIANIFAISSPKAGSQWAKALFDHPVVRAHTGLFTLPQLDYQKRHRRLPPGTFVPGMYMSYSEYMALDKPWPHRGFYVFRDPRNLVVSAYFSAIKTHRPVPGLEGIRYQMRKAPAAEGLHMAIDLMAPRLHEMESWVDVDAPGVAFFKLEQIGADHEGQVARIFQHCDVELSAEEFQRVVLETSRESLQRKDLAVREPGSESHYRIDRRGFRELFEDRHYEALEAIAPGLVRRLGYV